MFRILVRGIVALSLALVLSYAYFAFAEDFLLSLALDKLDPVSWTARGPLFRPRASQCSDPLSHNLLLVAMSFWFCCMIHAPFSGKWLGFLYGPLTAMFLSPERRITYLDAVTRATLTAVLLAPFALPPLFIAGILCERYATVYQWFIIPFPRPMAVPALLIGVTFWHHRLYWSKKKWLQGGRCSDCGYLLHGLVEPRCPECGTTFEQREAEGGRQDSKP